MEFHASLLLNNFSNYFIIQINMNRILMLASVCTLLCYASCKTAETSKEEEAKLAEWIKTGNDAADAKVDSVLDKVKESHWTPVILVCVVAVVILAWIVG